MASTLKINNLDTASGTTITIPTGKTLVGTDTGTLRSPGTPIQIVTATGGGDTTISTGNTWTNSSLQITITPKLASSKIHVMFTQPVRLYGTGSVTRGGVRLIRNISGGAQGQNVWNTGDLVEMFQIRGTSGTIEHSAPLVGMVLEHPNTTSAITYIVQGLYYPDSGTGQILMWRGSFGSEIQAIEYAQ